MGANLWIEHIYCEGKGNFRAPDRVTSRDNTRRTYMRSTGALLFPSSFITKHLFPLPLIHVPDNKLFRYKQLTSDLIMQRYILIDKIHTPREYRRTCQYEHFIF